MNPLKKLGVSVSKFFLGHSLPVSGGFWGWGTPRQWGRSDLLLQYSRYVYAVISAIAEEAAKVDFEVSKGGKPQITHPFIKLIAKPNPYASQFQFLEMHFTYMKLCGESFWYLVKGENSLKPKQLYLLRPDLVEVVPDKDSPTGAVKGYALSKDDGTKQPFEPDEILHFKMPNPLNPYHGLGTIQASKTYIETEQYASEWTKNSIYNSGRPSGVLSIKGVIDEVQFESIKAQFKDKYSGTQNAGKTMLLKGADGLDYQKLGMELGEVALKELKDMTRDDIMVMFRVSKTILGISDDVNRANAFEARAVFSRNVIMPELDRFIDQINAFLMPIWGEDFYLDYADPTLQSEEDRMAEWEKGWNKWLTTNDIRRERGLEPVEGGDVFTKNINEMAITKEPKKEKKLAGKMLT